MKRTATDQAFSPRIGRHLDAAAMFDAALEASTTSRPVVAAQLEVSPTDLARICDPTTGRAVPLEHVLGLPDDAYDALVSAMAARRGHAVVALPKPTVTADDLRALCDAQRETSDVITRGIEACADGHITRNEGTRLEEECDEAIAALLAIRERARVAKREGVVGIRRSA